MNKLEKALIEINSIDEFSLKNSIIHKLNPLAKLIVTIAYIAMVTSAYKYNPFTLLPWFIYPVIMVILSEMSIMKTLKRLIIIIPIILLIGLGNVFFNSTQVYVMGIKTTLGFLSFITFSFKSILSLIMVYIFISTTGIYKLAYGLIKIKVPEIFVWVIILLYRYIFIITQELNTILKAYSLVAPNEKGLRFGVWGSLLGALFYRTLEKGKNLYNSMYLRGFGENGINIDMKFQNYDYMYIFITFVIFILFKGLVKL